MQHGADGSHMAMMPGTPDLQGFVVRDVLLAVEGAAEDGDGFRGKGAEVTEGLLLDLAVLTIGAA